jgi:hypothetical protein
MSSQRRIQSSQSNGSKSKGPTTAQGKRNSSKNATTHGLLSRQILLRDESPACFESLMNDHLTRLQPADGVEFGMVEEMVANNWHLRRAMAIETRMLENAAALQPAPDPLDRLTAAFEDLAAKPALGLMHRYQTRLHLNYQRTLHNMLLLRIAAVPNEPSPIPEHPKLKLLPAPDPDPDPDAD